MSFPDFIVFGAMRAGTTSLYHYLNAHPEIGMSRMKETDFFIRSANYPLGSDWYRSQFMPGAQVYGEVSPNYAKHDLWPEVPDLIHMAAPEARLIFIARDPVDRFFSHYLHSWHVGHMSVPADELLESRNGQHMLSCSRYTAQLEHFLEVFPRERLLILDFDRLRLDPQAVLDETAAFLGVASAPVSDTTTRNETGSTARIPGFVQRAWRSRAMRRLDPLISRGLRNSIRTLLSKAPRRPDPTIPDDVRARVGALLTEDAQKFRSLSGQPFAGWSV